MKKPALHKDVVKPGTDGKMGWWYEIMPLTLDRGRICLTDGTWVDEHW